MKLKIWLIAILALTALVAEQLTPDQVINKKMIISPVLQPDGPWVLYSEYSYAESDSNQSGLRQAFAMNSKTGEVRQFTQTPFTYSNYKWSADGKQLIVKAKLPAMDKNYQLYSIGLNGGGYMQITGFNKGFGSWYLTKDQAGVVFTRADKKDSHNPYVNEINPNFNRLFFQDLKADTMAQITPDSLHVWTYDVAPDESFVVYTATKDAGVDYRYMFQQLYRYDFATGKTTALATWEGKLGSIAISPNSRYLAINGGVDISDPTDGTMFLIDLRKPMERKVLTPGIKATVEQFFWQGNQTIVFLATVKAHHELWEVDLSGEMDKLREYELGIGSISASRDGEMMAVTASAYNHPPELFVGKTGRKLNRKTNSNPAFDKIDFVKPEEISWKAKDGLTLYGLLYTPENANNVPLLIDVHGGPEAAETKGWNNWYSSWSQILVQKGMAVFLPNYRGSTGRGVEFAKMSLGDMMGKDFDDVLDGVDHLVAKGIVNSKKVAVSGGSYGGYSAAWGATKHTERFALALMFVGISNQISKIGTTDTPYENALVHWDGWAYDDNFEKSWDRSPLKYAKQGRTPIFIAAGEKDERVPPEQSIELYRALRHFNKVPVDLVVYKNEGHGNRYKMNRQHFQETCLMWIDKYILEK
jgi:dipeptidyl aminopeptidase/acylaminoacyl peptidase